VADGARTVFVQGSSARRAPCRASIVVTGIASAPRRAQIAGDGRHRAGLKVVEDESDSMSETTIEAGGWARLT
jgi:hypothetical protein